MPPLGPPYHPQHRAYKRGDGTGRDHALAVVGAVGCKGRKGCGCGEGGGCVGCRQDGHEGWDAVCISNLRMVCV